MTYWIKIQNIELDWTHFWFWHCTEHCCHIFNKKIDKKVKFQVNIKVPFVHLLWNSILNGNHMITHLMANLLGIFTSQIYVTINYSIDLIERKGHILTYTIKNTTGTQIKFRNLVILVNKGFESVQFIEWTVQTTYK